MFKSAHRRPSSTKSVLTPTMLAVIAACLTAFAVVTPAAPQAAPTAKARVSMRLREPDRNWVAKTLAGLSLRDKIAQLVQIRVMGRYLNRGSAEYRALDREIRENRVGGVILFAGNIYESAVLLNDLQTSAGIPLIVSADFERGASFRIEDTTSFPWTMAIGATGSEEYARQLGAITGREARALGVHWVYAPVMDVNNNPDNPVISIRSFGEDPQLVARLGAAFIRGAHGAGVLATAKHFPGHGDTAADSHLGLAVIPSDRTRLDGLELIPFRKAIEAGVDSIMSGHISVPALAGEKEIPATLSQKILTGLLRESLGFRGLVVTDALEMGGITTRYWTGQAAVRAIKAGADMLLLPPDATVAINEVVRAVKRGDISEERIETSVRKVLEAKTRLGLHRSRLVPLERIREVVASPDSRGLAREMADRSITVVKDEMHLLPLHPLIPRRILSLAISSDIDPSPAAIFQGEMSRRFPGSRTMSVDPRTSDELITSISDAIARSDVIVCASLVRVISGKGTIALPQSQRAIIEKALNSGKPVIWVALGSPYILRSVPQVTTYMCSFSYSDVSQLAAARALSGEIPITGRMPVSIPGYARVGDGLQIPRLDMTLRTISAEAAGLPKDAFREAEQLLSSFVDSKVFPGAALIVGYQGAIVLDAAVGKLDYARNSGRTSGDTIYDLASVTKAVSTTSAAMMLTESGRLLLHVPVQDYLPEFRGTDKEKVLVQHLLTHSSGLPSRAKIYLEARGYDEISARACSAPLEYPPGTRAQYSDLGMILLGEIIQRAAGRPLDKLVQESLFAPLGMNSTRYRPARSLIRRIAPTENDPWRKRVVRGEVHDENAFAMGGVAGHAGLFSSAHDLAVFAQMMLNGGMYDHRRCFSPSTIARFTALEIGNRALGWGKPTDADWTGKTFSPQAYGHSGFTGTSIWIDPQRQMFMVLLTNRVHPDRNPDRMPEVRQAISEAVVRALSPPTEAGSR